jgi:hypothetical protein
LSRREDVEFTGEHEEALFDLLNDDHHFVAHRDLEPTRELVGVLYLAHKDLRSSLLYAVRRAAEADEDASALRVENEALTDEVEELQAKIEELEKVIKEAVQHA